jgi:hypothetical protein
MISLSESVREYFGLTVSLRFEVTVISSMAESLY